MPEDNEKMNDSQGGLNSEELNLEDFSLDDISLEDFSLEAFEAEEISSEQATPGELNSEAPDLGSEDLNMDDLDLDALLKELEIEEVPGNTDMAEPAAEEPSVAEGAEDYDDLLKSLHEGLDTDPNAPAAAEQAPDMVSDSALDALLDSLPDDLPDEAPPEADSDFPYSLSEGMDDYTDMFSELTQQLDSSGVEQLSGMLDDDVSLDDQLAAALAADKEADSQFDLNDVNIVENVSIFNNLPEESELIFDADAPPPTTLEDIKIKREAEREARIKRVRRKRKDKLSIARIKNDMLTAPPGRLYSIAAVMVGCVILLGFVMYTLSGTYRRELHFGQLAQGRVPLTQPSGAGAGVGSNQILVETPVIMNGSLYEIRRIVLDAHQTVFHFNHNVPFYRYNITMTDESGKRYFRDLYHLETEPTEGTALRMEPLNEGVVHFSLHISDPRRNEETTVDFAVRDGVEHVPTLHLIQPLEAGPDAPGVYIQIDEVRLGSAGSSVVYNIRWPGPVRAFAFGEVQHEPNVNLIGGGNNLWPHRSDAEHVLFTAERTILGRQDFEPLTADVFNLNIRNLFEVRNLNRRVEVAPLFENAEDTQYTIDLGDYVITLERFGIFGNRAVLVLHGIIVEDEPEDDPWLMLADIPEPNLEPVRIETRLDVDLILNVPGGEVIRLEGVTRSMDLGSDIVFTLDMDPEELNLRTIPMSNFALDIRAAHVRRPNVAVPLNVNWFTETAPEGDQILKDWVASAFMTRLAYKSGEISRGQIAGFAPQVLNNNALMQHYRQVSGANSPLYTAQVLSMTYRQGQYLLVVREVWSGSSNQLLTDFTLTHKVVVEVTGDEPGQWLIISNEIVG